MKDIQAEDIERLLPYWKPEPDKEYNGIVLSNWHIKMSNFGVDAIFFNVIQVDDLTFSSSKEFSTRSSSFITQIWPIIDRAQQYHRSEIYIALKLSAKKYTLFDLYDHVKENVVPKARPVFLGMNPKPVPPVVIQ